MNKWIVGGVAAIVVAGAAFWFADRAPSNGPADMAGTDNTVPNPLRFATEGSYPPYNMYDTSGSLTGFDIELANELCRRLEVTCQVTAQNWDGLIPALQAGKYDAIVAGMSITDERREAVDFTQGYTTTPGYFVAPNTSPLQQVPFGIDEINLTEIDPAEQQALDQFKEILKGKTVGVQVATIHANFLEQYLGDVITIRRYDTQDNMVLDLTSGRIDAALADAVAWAPFLDSEQGKEASYFGPSLDGGLFGQGIGIAIAKNRPALLDALNGALTAMKQDGSLAAMAEKWFGFDASMP